MKYRPTTLSLLRDLIGFPTVSRDPNRALIDYCADYLRSIGASVDIITAEAGRKANLFATIGPQDVPGVMLSGHTDVVPVDGQAWSKPPFEAVVNEGRVYGRGTADMKGFVASALFCASKAADRQLTTPLHLALSHDEEIGCVGVHSLVDMLADAPVKPAMCIVGEPTSMAIATGHKGKTAIEATCIGSAAHSALAPQAVNAIHLACDLISQIRHLQEDIAVNGTQDKFYDIPYTTLHAGLVTGGVALNIVPDHAVVTFEIRNLTTDNPDEILDRLRGAISPVITIARQRAVDADIAFKIAQGEQLNAKLLDANGTFSAIMGFIKSPLIKSFRKFDSSLFTQRGVNGVRGLESMSRDRMFQTMERDVFALNSPEAIEQFDNLKELTS